MKRFGQLILVLSTLGATAACTTINPYTGEQQVSRAVQYGALAGVTCALVGATENSRRARNAGLGCAAIGAGVGAYMDAQEAELRAQLEGSGVQVVRNGDNLDLIMPGNVTFNTDQYTVKPEFYPVLNAVAQVLYKFKDTRLEVVGHTDSTGPADYNYSLSGRRASSVAAYLGAQGVDPGRLLSRGVGPDRPLASNASEGGRALNRRVELHIVPLPAQG